MASVNVNKHCAFCRHDLSSAEDLIMLADIKWSETRHLICKDKDAYIINFPSSTNSRNVYCDVFCLFKDLETHPSVKGAMSIQ